MKASFYRSSVLLLTLLSLPFSCYAYQFSLDGQAAGQYPIVMEVDRNANGSITGRYAYTSTLDRQGRDKRTSWLYIYPVDSSTKDYVIKDSKGNVQERWTNVRMYRSNGLNRLEASVTNAKGKTFGIFAVSASTHNTAGWAGSYSIYSEGYRNSPPPIAAELYLTANRNGYTGSFNMKIADDDALRNGMFFCDVTATANNGVLKVTLHNPTYGSGVDGAFFGRNTEYYPNIPDGSQILEIIKTGSTYRLIPLGNMKKYLTDTIELTIVKTE